MTNPHDSLFHQILYTHHDLADQYLLSDSARIRWACLVVIRQRQSTNRLPDVVTLLNDSDKWIRVEAMRVLSVLKQSPLADYLPDLLTDDTPIVRLEAIYTCHHLKLLHLIRNNSQIWQDETRVWESRGEKISAVLRLLFTDFEIIESTDEDDFDIDDLFDMEFDDEDASDLFSLDALESLEIEAGQKGAIDWDKAGNLGVFDDVEVVSIMDRLDGDTNTIDADMPDWLKEQVDDSVSPEDVLPEWLSGENVDIESVDDIPDWLRETMEDVDVPPVEQSPAPVPKTSEPDFDSMTPEELTKWMESLAMRQGATEGLTTSADMEVAEVSENDERLAGKGDYIPYGWTEERWKAHLAQQDDDDEEPATALGSNVLAAPSLDDLFGGNNIISSENKLVEAQFSLYNQPEVIADTRSYIYVYAHNENHLPDIQQDIQKFRDDLGGTVPQPRQAKQNQSIEVGTEITIVPECDEIEFEPASMTKKWRGNWTRFVFEFYPTEDLVGEMLFIRVSVRIKGFEIAHIKTSSVVTTSVPDMLMMDNPLEQAMQRGDLSPMTAKPYNKMFISYSRHDQVVALQRAKEIENLLGAEVFLDVKSLRAGDDWQYQLAKAIEDADIFHLLWSEHSASSEYCRYEWQYALTKKCPENMCIGVIRPIYWQKPVPTPPDELSHLHFEYVELSNT